MNKALEISSVFTIKALFIITPQRGTERMKQLQPVEALHRAGQVRHVVDVAHFAHRVHRQ